MALESNSTPVTMPHTKFGTSSSKDVGGDGFQAKIHVLRQIL